MTLHMPNLSNGRERWRNMREPNDQSVQVWRYYEIHPCPVLVRMVAQRSQRQRKWSFSVIHLEKLRLRVVQNYVWFGHGGQWSEIRPRWNSLTWGRVHDSWKFEHECAQTNSCHIPWSLQWIQDWAWPWLWRLSHWHFSVLSPCYTSVKCKEGVLHWRFWLQVRHACPDVTSVQVDQGAHTVVVRQVNYENKSCGARTQVMLFQVLVQVKVSCWCS